jgi:hypothetical protein
VCAPDNYRHFLCGNKAAVKGNELLNENRKRHAAAAKAETLA